MTSVWAIAVVATAASTLPSSPKRRLAAFGLLAVAFGLGSAAVAGGGDLTLAAAGPVSRAIDGGFVIAGALLIVWAGILAWVSSRAAAAVIGASGVLIGWLARGLLVPAGIGADVAAAGVLAIGAALVALAGVVSRRWPPRAVSNPGSGSVPRMHASRRGGAGVLGALLAIVAPNVWLIIGGALLAAGAASLLVLAVTAAGLLPSLWFMHTVAGPTGLGVATLETIPFSAAAEAMLAPVLALGAFGLFGLWPLQRWATPLLVPVGVAVLVRLGAAVPAGLQSWETVLVPIGVIALVHALCAPDEMEALAAAAWLAAVTGGRTAAILLAAAVVLGVVAAWARPARPAIASWIGALTWGAAGAGGALALRSLLGAEVVYAVMSMATAAALIARAGHIVPVIVDPSRGCSHISPRTSPND